MGIYPDAHADVSCSSHKPFIKFNVPIAISMVWLSNPITMPFMYYMEYKTGLLLLGSDGVGSAELTLNWFSENWGDIIVPLYIGTIPYPYRSPYCSYHSESTMDRVCKKEGQEEREIRGITLLTYLYSRFSLYRFQRGNIGEPDIRNPR